MVPDPTEKRCVWLHEPTSGSVRESALYVEAAFRGAGSGRGASPSTGRCGYDQHREREPGVVRDEAEQRRPDAAEPDGEPHRYAGREPDAPWQVLLSHNDRNAECPHGGRADEDEQRHTENGPASVKQ